MKNNSHFLSVIVPVYKQAKSIRQDLYTIIDTLDQIRYDYELIAVIDGTSVDNSFSEATKCHLKKLKVIGYPNNHGKGYALRYGMAHTKGDYVAFIDAGMEIDPNGLSMILEHLEWYNADIIVGSKRHPASMVNYPLNRKILSIFAWIFAKNLLNINVHDTQAGLKIFKRAVLEKVLPRLLVKNYAIDLEILAVANHLGFSKIYEAPIKLSYDFTSLTGSFNTIYKTFLDALAIFYRLHLLHYYDDYNRRKWVLDPELNLRVNTGEYEKV
ncbi:MAG: glycosyltransferase [Candidatus Shapirobacteria bacterium]|nr:glycosyltransferase [Candidatus Shapirobacteria bacterium]